MGKGGFLKFAALTALGAIAGYATYMASKDEFSDETKDRYGKVLNKIKNVGTDIKRTYTAVGDKDSFKTATSNLGNSAMKLAEKTGDLMLSASSDMYKKAKVYIKDAYNKMSEDEASYDDLDDSTAKPKKTIKKKPAKKSAKKTSKK